MNKHLMFTCYSNLLQSYVFTLQLVVLTISVFCMAYLALTIFYCSSKNRALMREYPYSFYHS
jgi:hypothetical protein